MDVQGNAGNSSDWAVAVDVDLLSRTHYAQAGFLTNVRWGELDNSNIIVKS